MTPKERRERLFRTGRPNVRELDFSNMKDMAILWDAYQKGSFDFPEGLEKPEFVGAIMNLANQYHLGWMIEDKTSQYADDMAPIGLMMAHTNGWEVEPHFNSFSWATPRNKLRAFTAFFQKLRYDKDVGVVNVHSLKKDKPFFKHLAKNYGVLNYLGCIPHGDFRGDKHIFYVRGRKK